MLEGEIVKELSRDELNQETIVKYAVGGGETNA